ncbi:hypothetical protein LUZ60_003613 [Juncus effusus]|nr:hypothetical protein LUZ60_003613 [Juncus effusus]
MEGVVIGKMKRKDMDEVLDDFSEFSLSSPARKIRRLDAELPPIMEEDESNSVPFMTGGVQSMDEMETTNQERALVLYRLIDPHLVVGPGSTNHSFSLSSDLIPGFKDQFFNRCEPVRVKNENLALVPWIPNESSQFENEEILMEIEEEEEREKEEREKVYINNSRDENFHQHCLIPPFPINQPVNPVMWSW